MLGILNSIIIAILLGCKMSRQARCSKKHCKYTCYIFSSVSGETKLSKLNISKEYEGQKVKGYYELNAS